MDKLLRDKINNSILNNDAKVLEYFLPFNEDPSNHYDEIINNGKILASPIVLKRSQENMMQKNINRILQILSELPEILFDGDYDSYYNQLGMEPIEKEIVKDFNILKLDTCMARPDTFFDGENFKILEFNISSALGGVIANEVLGRKIYQRLFYDLNIWEKQIYNLPSVIKNMSQLFKEEMNQKKEINIVLIMFRQDQQEEVLYLQTMKGLLEAEGFHVYICDPKELEYKEGLMFKNKKMDIGYRVFLWSLKRLKEDKFMQNIVQAAKKDEIKLFVDLSSKIYSNKANLSFLSELVHSEKLNEQDRSLLKAHIPWTRILKEQKAIYGDEEIDVIPYIINNKDWFILKPFSGAGGENVMIGKFQNMEEWTNAVSQKSETKSYLVQEYIEPVKLNLPIIDFSLKQLSLEELSVVLSIFMIGKKVSGYFVRCQYAGNEVINACSGALSTNAFIIE